MSMIPFCQCLQALACPLPTDSGCEGFAYCFSDRATCSQLHAERWALSFLFWGGSVDRKVIT